MSTQTEFTGKSVEAATVEAEKRLGKSRNELEIQVVSQGSRGVFGIGGEPARIAVRDPSAIMAPPTTEEVVQAPPAQELPSKVEPARQERPKQRPEQRTPRPQRRSPDVERHVREEVAKDSNSDVDLEGLSESARDIVASMLTKMGFEAEVEIRSSQEPVTLDILGENLGLLIGRRGDSLASLQFMVNVILSKQFHHWPHVVIDVQGYRARREQSLSSLGKRVADRVRRNRRPFTLEAMPANDRRIIHISLRERSDVETYSVGEGASRRVVIAPKR